MSSRIWNSLTDYQFLAEQWKEEKDQEGEETRQILKITWNGIGSIGKVISQLFDTQFAILLTGI